MRKNGFTLVELMAVIVLIAVVAIIGTYGVSGINRAIKNNMWESKLKLIESAAIKWGEDNENKLTSTSKCIEDSGSTIRYCYVVTVQHLLNKRYITSKDKDADDKKIIINDVTEESVNELKVYVYKKNATGVIYAKISGE